MAIVSQANTIGAGRPVWRASIYAPLRKVGLSFANPAKA
jgi:hypothetical protein